MTPHQRKSAIAGIVFTLLVVSLLLYLHTQKSKVDPLIPDSTYEVNSLVVCRGTPVYAMGAPLKAALEWWSARGYKVDHRPVARCADTCVTTDGTFPCLTGSVSLAPRPTAWSNDHIARTYLLTDGTVVISLPHQIEPSDPTNGPSTTLLRADIGALVVVHELGHAFNLGHTYTPLGGTGLIARKSGQVMHPKLSGLGWGDEGIPPGPDAKRPAPKD